MPANASNLKVHFLDVGQGDCTFIVPPKDEGEPILFDCADLYTAERFVANHQIATIEAVVASHLDIDHVRGLLPFLENHFKDGGRVNRLVLGLDRVPRTDRDKNLRALIERALEWEKNPPHEGFRLEPPFRTDSPLRLADGSDWSIDLVLPWYGTVTGELAAGGQDPNHCSAVLRVKRGDTSVLIGGDAPLGSWERLEPSHRSATAIRVPHHGGEIRSHGTEWSEFADLYDAVQADLTVVSVGTNNGHRHPDENHTTAMTRGGVCRLLCTQLTPRCHPTPADLREAAVSQASMVEWPYRHRVVVGHPASRPSTEVPCAGSVVVWLTADGETRVEPSPSAEHSKFLLRVDAPMCERPT